MFDKPEAPGAPNGFSEMERAAWKAGWESGYVAACEQERSVQRRSSRPPMFETFGEYGHRMAGITCHEIYKPAGSPQVYLVTYVIEDMANAMGSLDIVAIEKITDPFGMSSLIVEPVESVEESRTVEEQFRKDLHQALFGRR